MGSSTWPAAAARPCPARTWGHGLWTSGLVTTNGWIKVSLPTVTGFFTGTATIEVFGTWPSVDVRVTFPDGHQIVRAGVARSSRIAIQ